MLRKQLENSTHVGARSERSRLYGAGACVRQYLTRLGEHEARRDGYDATSPARRLNGKACTDGRAPHARGMKAAKVRCDASPPRWIKTCNS